MSESFRTDGREVGEILAFAFRAAQHAAQAVPGHRRSEPRWRNLDLAVAKTPVTRLHGLPFPVQFRNQEAIAAWKNALASAPVSETKWKSWALPEQTCHEMRNEIEVQLFLASSSQTPWDNSSKREGVARQLALESSTNILFELHKGTLIESTPALESLLVQSDVDLALPMRMVAPPFSAQYVHFGTHLADQLKVPGQNDPEYVFDGAFCFVAIPPGYDLGNAPIRNIELIFIGKRRDCVCGYLSLGGFYDRDDASVGDWVQGCLARALGTVKGTDLQHLHAAVSYVVKLFLYLALKGARIVQRAEYGEAQLRLNRIGSKKQAKLGRRMSALYDGIVVGPAALPAHSSSASTGHTMPPHWRRGHFRMQPHGRANQERKLIFVAPLLVHADRLDDETPNPRTYRAFL